MHHPRLCNSQSKHSGIKICRFLLHQTPATRTSYLRLIKFSGGIDKHLFLSSDWMTKADESEHCSSPGVRRPSVKV